MSFVFRARRTTETGTGAGGKIVRGRRHAVAAAHPYARPESPPPSENPSWVFGLFAGSGKLLSSVFGSSSQDLSSSSSSSDDDEDDGYSSNDDSICSIEVDESNQNGTALVSTKDLPLDTQPIAQKTEAKCAIERLLLQETFTRDECTELMKIIQSRVVDCPTMKEGEDAPQKELHSRTVGNEVFPGAWRSLSQSRKSLEAYPYSMNGLSTLSPSASAFKVHTPNLCNTAIMEAKKWLEEKKLESSSNSERDHGSFLLSTDVLPHAIEGDAASPVDMAKSYMRSRPPWASPLSNIEFKTPPPIGIHRHMDESSYSMAHYSLPSIKELKRNSLAIGSWDTIEDTRRVRLKSTDDILENHAVKQIDSSETMFDNEPTQTLSAPDKGEVVGITHDSSSLAAANSVDACLNLQAELTVDESCRNGILHPSGGKAVEVDLVVTNHVDNRTNNLISIRSISMSEETVGVEDPKHGISSSATLSLETEHSGPEKGISGSDPIIIISEKNKDSEESQKAKVLVNCDFASHDSPVPDSISVQHNGLALECEDQMQIEANGLACSTLDSEDQIQIEANGLAGLILEGEDQMQKEANGLGNNDDVNYFLSSQASSMTLNAEPGWRPDETVHNSTGSENGELAADKLMENCKPAINETKTRSDGLQNGISRMMDKAPQIQPQKRASTRAAMRGKNMGYSRRGRGRGK